MRQKPKKAKWIFRHSENLPDLHPPIISIPKSSRKERILENSQIFDFELFPEEMKLLDYLNKNILTPKILFFTMNESLNADGAYVNDNEIMIRVNGEPFSISINDLSLKGKHNQYNSRKFKPCIVYIILFQ